MKVSVITVTFNSDKYLEETILSIKNQDYKNVEYIIIDGGSTDNTMKIIDSYSDFITKVISEKDNGIYDAMNKGLKYSTGDIIGFLNSDDVFFDNKVLTKIVSCFSNEIDCVFGDVLIVDEYKTDSVIRNYSSKNFSVSQFQYGHMPPHPSFYGTKLLYQKVGNFKIDYRISADYDYLLRSLLVNRARFKYLNFTSVRMRSGGISSSLFNKIILNNEIYRSCKENNVSTNYLKIYSKYFFKIHSFINLLKWR